MRQFILPDLGEGLTEGEVARWLVAEGQEVAEDEPLVEIQTDKTTVEIPSPAAGVVSRILVSEGEVVPVGTVLVVIGGDGVWRRVTTCHKAPNECAQRRWSSGSRESSASTSARFLRPGRRGASPKRTYAARPRPRTRSRRGAANRCAESGG